MRFRLGNPPEVCSISHIIFDDEENRFVLQSFNDYTHIV